MLLRRERTGIGGFVDTSLAESMLDLQFELLSAHAFDDQLRVNRGPRNAAHAFLPAPYGIYPTADGYLAIAMTPINSLGELIGLESIASFTNPEDWWSHQEEITQALSKYLATQKTEHWLNILDAADVWCAPVLTLPELVEHDGFAQLEMMQETVRGEDDEIKIKTTRSPMRLDGKTLKNRKGAPRVGEDTEKIRIEFLGGM